MTDTERRVAEARYALTGAGGTTGLQAWLRDEVERETGWRPSKSTVHRHVKEKRSHERIAETVVALEERAEGVDPPDFGELGRKRERNILLCADWLRGVSLDDVADRYNVSGSRAAQIIYAAGIERLS